MANYDHMYYGGVMGASLPSKMCEEAMQVEIQHTREMNVYTTCEHETVKDRCLTSIGMDLHEQE